MYQMKKYINYEYKRLYFKLGIYFVIDIFSYSISVYCFTSIRLSIHLYEHFSTLMFIINLPQILMSCGVLYLKDNKDMLQELSKLDYLIPVSIFQR